MSILLADDFHAAAILLTLLSGIGLALVAILVDNFPAVLQMHPWVWAVLPRDEGFLTISKCCSNKLLCTFAVTPCEKR